MKKLLFIPAFLLALSTYAQSVQVTEQSALFTNGSQNALVTTIYQNSRSDVMDKWKTYLKNYKNVKVKTAKDEVVGDNVLIKEWGNNPVDIYARFEENKQEKTVRMMVAYNLGGAYLTSTLDANKYAAAEKMVRDFAVETTKAPLILKVKDAEKVLGKMEGDRDGIEKDIKNLRSDIENYRDKISKAEKDITKAEDELSKKKSEIDGQRINIQLLNNQAGEVK